MIRGKSSLKLKVGGWALFLCVSFLVVKWGAIACRSMGIAVMIDDDWTCCCLGPLTLDTDER